MIDLIQDRVYLLCPDEWLGVFIVDSDVIVDGRDEFLNACECAATDALPCDLAEPALYEIEPRRARWRKVHVEPRMFVQPVFYVGVCLSAIVIDNQVQVQFAGRLPV